MKIIADIDQMKGGTQVHQHHRNDFSTSSEYDGLESDRDNSVRFRVGETDETKALDRENLKTRYSMASCVGKS